MMRKWWHPWVFAIAAIVASACSNSSTPNATAPASTSDASSEPSTADPSVVDEYDLTELSGSVHIDPPTTFDQSPSVGGDHYPFWQNCGFYSVPVIEGAAAHSLEHGAVWITFNADLLSDEELGELEALASANARLLISPYQHDEKLVLSSWGAQLRLADVAIGDAAIGDFIATYVDRDGIPEPGVSCSGAVGEPPANPRALQDGTNLEASWT